MIETIRNECRRILVVATAVLYVCCCFGQVNSRREIWAIKVDQGPEIDGLVNDPVWMTAPAATDFIQQNPNFGVPSTERTEVRILFDDIRLNTLYTGSRNCIQ